MVRHVDAIFSHGAFRPLQLLTMPEGTRVHLSVEEQGVEEGTDVSSVNPAAKIRTPKLAYSKDAVDFVLEVRDGTWPVVNAGEKNGHALLV